MRSSARLLAVFVVPCLISFLAFAGDDGKPASTTTTVSTTDSANAAPAPKPTKSSVVFKPTWTPPAVASDSMRGEGTPAGQLFFGYSYLRLNTSTTPASISENFDFIPGGVAALQGNIKDWFGLKGQVGGYNLH